MGEGRSRAAYLAIDLLVLLLILFDEVVHLPHCAASHLFRLGEQEVDRCDILGGGLQGVAKGKQKRESESPPHGRTGAPRRGGSGITQRRGEGPAVL